MTVLTPGESTTALTEQMTMRSITNAEYAGIDDINITLTGYAIGVENKDHWLCDWDRGCVCGSFGSLGSL